jgi:hypothetical protein
MNSIWSLLESLDSKATVADLDSLLSRTADIGTKAILTYLFTVDLSLLLPKLSKFIVKNIATKQSDPSRTALFNTIASLILNQNIDPFVQDILNTSITIFKSIDSSAVKTASFAPLYALISRGKLSQNVSLDLLSTFITTFVREHNKLTATGTTFLFIRSQSKHSSHLWDHIVSSQYIPV